MSDEYTPTYILTWNPDKYRWRGYEEICDQTRNGDFLYDTDWSCKSKSPKEGDRFILLMQGQKKRNGIVGYGTFRSEPYEFHTGMPFGRKYVDIRIIRLWNYKQEVYPKTAELMNLFPEQFWRPQFSGVRVKALILPELWKYITRSKYPEGNNI